MKHDLSVLKNLSPFELKDVLISVATENLPKRPMLNAGRGNPSFVALEAREAFFYLGQFALSESARVLPYEVGSFGGFPVAKGIESRFDAFLEKHQSIKGVQLLSKMLSFVRDQFKVPTEEFLVEITTAIIGCNYPVPGRMLVHIEHIVKYYILKEMGGESIGVNNIDLFALEGGTAAMTYIFNTLAKNFLLKKGDTVAIGLPIFQPYIEFAHLGEYHFETINPTAVEGDDWQWTQKEIDKLLDPKIKIFYVVNPANPSSTKINDRVMDALAEVVKKRPDLMILTDDVYGTFSDNFESLFARCPYNTMLVYSFSKYFGATGWRLGVIALQKNNIYDDLIKKLSKEETASLIERYQTIVVPPLKPQELKMIDRLMAESRSVALNHTSGLSLPQQVQMLLFAMYDYMDTAAVYRTNAKLIVLNRAKALFRGLDLEFKHDVDNCYYYHIFDIEHLASEYHGKEFGSWLVNKHEDVEILYRFSDEGGLVFLPGRGFGIDRLTVRISLANLHTQDYVEIGRMIKHVLGIFHKEFKNKK